MQFEADESEFQSTLQNETKNEIFVAEFSQLSKFSKFPKKTPIFPIFCMIKVTELTGHKHFALINPIG